MRTLEQLKKHGSRTMRGYRTTTRQERGERKQMEICGAEGETPVREAERSPVVS